LPRETRADPLRAAQLVDRNTTRRGAKVSWTLVKPVRCDIIKVKEGGQIRHIFFDTGRDQLIAFMEARGWRISRP
jgi:hypothetical protein